MPLDMTKGKPMRLLLHFAFPLMLSSILQQLYTTCDSLIVGQMLGTEAFAAISSSSYLDWFPLSMIIGLTQGFGVVLSQRFGAKDEQGFRRAFSMSLLIAMSTAIVLSVVGAQFLYPFLRLLKTPDELITYTADYLRVLWIGLAVTALYNVLGAVLRALGDSRTPFIALIVSTIVNIGLDYLLIAGFGMGVDGAALATLISRGVAIAFCLWKIQRTRFAAPRRADWRPHGPTVRELLRLGIPPLFSFSVIATGELAVQAAMNICGVIFVTGTAAARRYFTLLTIVGSALEGSVATFVGQNTGAKQPQRVIDGTRQAVWLGFIASLVTSALVILFSRPMIMLFVPQGNAETIQIGMDALRVECMFLSGLYLLCLHRAALQGMGNALIPMLSGFLELALRLACVWGLPLLFGREGLYFTDAITWAGATVLLMVSYYTTRRRMRAEIAAAA